METLPGRGIYFLDLAPLNMMMPPWTNREDFTNHLYWRQWLMNSLQNFNYNGQVIQRRGDGFINASQMCFANGKLLADWNRLKATKAYVEALSEAMGIPTGELLNVQNGNQTWVHPSLAINLARWISPRFAVWCDAHIFNLMATGQTSLAIDPIEEMKLKIELARLETQKSQNDLALLNLRNTIVSTCPEPVQQKILGFQIVEKVEYRDRLIVGGQTVNNGNCLTKTQLCQRYNLLTKNGSPNYRKLNALLSEIGMDTDHEAWEMSASLQENYQFKRDYLPQLDHLIVYGDRQLNLGE